MSRTLTVSAAGLGVLLALTGVSACDDTSTASRPADDGRPSASARPGEPTGTKPADLDIAASLPLAKYSVTVEEKAVLNKAESKVRNSCLQDFGEPPMPSPGVAPPNDRDTGGNRRYGLLDPVSAQRYGYQLPPGTTAGPAGLPQPSPRQAALLSGVAADGEKLTAYRGRPVPLGGCSADARRRIYAEHQANAGREAAQSIDMESYKSSLKDPGVVASFAAWSRCMHSRGFTYASPLAVTDDPQFADAEADAEERAVATADVECKQRVGLTETWLAAESTVQRKMIEGKKTELASLLASRQKMLADAAAILRNDS
ncbi:hypothetical protein OG242_19855 [Streptomyces sp. NBC_00727]|uniref:hypothetical protein n=1 Tax=Streptomyces sp. NBC_00727 TaxID=2903675 RepID=UPI00387022CC